nr:ABC transporter permease subunit [bacterium]
MKRKAGVPARRARRGLFSPSLWPMTVTTLLLVVIPLGYIIWMSFMKKDAVWGVGNEFTFGNYLKMLDPMYGRVFADSFGIAALTTVLLLGIGYPFAYFTARLPKRWRSVVLLLMIAPFWLNSLIRLNGWVILLKADGPVNTALQAMGLVDGPVKLLYTFGALVLGMVYALAPLMVLAIYNSVEKLDNSLLEASRDLGAGRVRTFFSVTLPLTSPGILAGCVLVFVPSVGLFFIADMMYGGKQVLLGNLIKDQLLSARNWPFGAALSVVMLALITASIILYKKLT